MKNLLRSFSLLLAVVLLASLCACRLQGTPQPSDEASAPTVPSEEPTAPVTEKPESATEPSGETEPYVIDDENFEIFSELDSTYWYIGSDPTITLKDFGLKITLPDGWVDRVEIIRNASQDDLELYIGNSALMLAYDMESADPDIKGSDGYFDWVLCVNEFEKTITLWSKTLIKTKTVYTSAKIENIDFILKLQICMIWIVTHL